MRDRRGFEPIAIWGLIFTVLMHGGIIVGVLLYKRSLMAAEQPPPPPSYVVARLVRKGKPKDPRHLPNKIVPQEATRKVDAVDATADADGPAARKKKRDLRQARVADKLNDALARAALLAQAQQEIEAEGDPNGVAGGTARSARDGDPYITRIADLWNRSWSLPAIIPRNEARKLFVLVVVRIDKSGEIQFPLKFDRRSGNAHFDNSIIAAWRSIGRIPLPPPDRFASILANGLPLKLNWKGIQ